jgi:ectoine hydroxylase-related dioxygenase (phytanoyl-CoA dioxygenase family)
MVESMSEAASTTTAPGAALRGPARLEFPLDRWSALAPDERERAYAAVDREIEEVGIVVIAGALSPEACDRYTAIFRRELQSPTRIERAMHERRRMRDGYKLYNLTARHPDFLELITFPFVVGFMRRHLGDNMILHSSEGAIIPPGGGNPPPGLSDPHSGWHFDGYARIPNYFLSLNSIYYLVDTSPLNGATRYIPGTHKEFITLEEALRREPRHCPVKKGDVVLFNPYLFHAGSPNNSDADRPVIINYYQRWYVKQEYDYFRTRTIAQVRAMTPEQRRVLGYHARMMRDIDEIYMIRREVAEFDPVGKLE